MYLICVAFLGLTCNSELASANVPESSSSAPTAKRKSQDIGSLSDFAWQAWLLMDAQNGFQHGVDSATLMRRITPKSVFIAPALPACAEGYRADTMGRCVKSVNIDENAHMSFLLERLNAMYGNSQDADGNKNDQRKSTGPLQLNIPLIPSDPKPSSTKVEPEETFSMDSPVVMPPRNKTHSNDEEKTRPHEVALASAYEMKNDTMLDEKEKLEEKTTFLAGNSSIDDVKEIDQKIGAVVSITNLAEETNDTNFSKMMDYKIPTDLKISLNTSSVKSLNASDIAKENVSTEKSKNFTEMSSTLIFLISSTRLPSIADDLSVTQNETVGHVTVQMSNVTSNQTAKEVIAVSVPDSALPDKSAEVSSVVTDEQRDNETHVDDETSLESSKLNESQETEFVYDEEEEDAEYSYSTDTPDDEDSTEMEKEEILRHGEAGMTIPMRNIERPHRDQQNQTADQKKMLEINDQIMIRFNNSTPTEDKDEAGSNVSSEVSINGDLILETTLLDVNTEKLQIATKSPNVIRNITKSGDDDPKESFGKSPDTEPDLVIFQEVQNTTPTNLHERKQTEHLKFEDKKNDELERRVAPFSSKPLLYDIPEERPITEIRVSEKEESTVKKNVLQENPKENLQLNVPVSDFKQTTMNLGSTEDYVRFPDHVKQPQDGYVRFPSSEANSIHNLDYKQHHPIDDVDPHDGTSTKSSVPVRQKPVYYLPSWKPERLQIDHVPVSEKQKQRPDLLRFWSKMPLIRDPDIYPVDQVPDDDAEKLYSNRFLRGSRTRKLNPLTPEVSLENVDKARAQKRRMSISG